MAMARCDLPVPVPPTSSGVALLGEESAAARQVADQRLVGRRAGEVEILDAVLGQRQLGNRQLVLDRAGLLHRRSRRGEQVADDAGRLMPALDAGRHHLVVGRLDRGQAIAQHRRQHLDQLGVVAVVKTLQPASHPLQAGGQRPILERGTVSSAPGFLGEHRHVMPRVVYRLAAAKAALMLADGRAVLADDDAIGVSPGSRPAGRPHAEGDRVFVVVEPHQAGLRDRGLCRVEPVERAGDRYTSCGRSASKACQIGRSASSGCRCALA